MVDSPYELTFCHLSSFSKEVQWLLGFSRESIQRMNQHANDSYRGFQNSFRCGRLKTDSGRIGIIMDAKHRGLTKKTHNAEKEDNSFQCDPEKSFRQSWSFSLHCAGSIDPSQAVTFAPER
ncbi:hypothetical protein TNCV_535271 [Trichonephila clavipes]|nr:hypothetical protein TNCV_535271 [Trichonephila clavipes]